MIDLLRLHKNRNAFHTIRDIEERPNTRLLSAYLLIFALLVSGLTSNAAEPTLRTRILLEFGKLVPPQLEEPAVNLAGDLYALGFRASGAGSFTVINQYELIYNQANKLGLDLYIPQSAVKPVPVVVIIHGGGWKYFTKASASGYSRFLASHGFAVAAVDYRVSSVAKWPAQLDDLQRAVRFLRSKGPELGIDPSRIAALGDSAGGHLAAMLGLTGATTPGLDLVGVVAYYGVYDMLPLVSFADGPYENPINQLLGKTDDLLTACREASPVHHVTSMSPPFLLIHGLEDSVVPVTQTGSFSAALQNAGVPVETLYVQGADHMLLGLPGPISPPLATIDRTVLSFLRRVLAVK